MRMKTSLVAALLLSTCGNVHAGLSYSEKEYHKFRYEVDGEIEVKPDLAVYPLFVSVKSTSYSQSLIKAQQTLESIKGMLEKNGKNELSLSTSDTFAPNKASTKILDVSFFGDDKEKQTTKMIFNVNVNFTEKHGFWERAKLVAGALDFVRAVKKTYKDDEDIDIVQGEAYYAINDIEQYRKPIIESIYKKARATADVIEKNENSTLIIDYITFGQRIKQEILGFEKASLTINATIEFHRTDKP